MASLFHLLLVPIIILVLASIATIILFFVAKNDQIIDHKKLLLVILLGALILTMPAILIVSKWSFIPTVYIFCASCSLFIGYIYVSYYPKMVIKPDQEQWWMQILILLTTTMMSGPLVFLIFHYMSDIDYGVMATFPLIFIFIPLFFYYTLNTLLAIPVEIFHVWYYNTKEHPLSWSGDYLGELFVFDIELHKNRNDSSLTTVKAKAPRTMIFKDWFHRFLEDYNKKYLHAPIESNGTGDNDHFGWTFYVKPSFLHLKRYVNFDKTIQENHITDKSTIVARRVISSVSKPEAWQETTLVNPEAVSEVPPTREGAQEQADQQGKNDSPQALQGAKSQLTSIPQQIGQQLKGQIPQVPQVPQVPRLPLPKL